MNPELIGKLRVALKTSRFWSPISDNLDQLTDQELLDLVLLALKFCRRQNHVEQFAELFKWPAVIVGLSAFPLGHAVDRGLLEIGWLVSVGIVSCALFVISMGLEVSVSRLESRFLLAVEAVQKNSSNPE